MSMTKVSAKRKDDTNATEVEYDFGDNLDEAVKKFGGDVVFAKFKQSAIIDLQSMIRRALEATEEKVDKEGKVVRKASKLDIDALQTQVNGWKPDNKVTVRMSAAEKVKKAVGDMTPEERADLIAQLTADSKPAKAGKR